MNASASPPEHAAEENWDDAFSANSHHLDEMRRLFQEVHAFLEQHAKDDAAKPAASA